MVQYLQRAKSIRPQLGRQTLERQRISDELARGVELPLTIVSGPAGWGKTTALALWDRNRTEPSAWMLLGPDDDSLDRFLRLAIAGIQIVCPDVGNRTLTILNQVGPDDVGRLVGAFSDEMFELESDLVLIVDDLQRIESREIFEFISQMVQFPPPHLKWVIGTRGEPRFNLAELRAQGRVLQVTSFELAFTPDEAGAYLQLVGNGLLEPDQCESICRVAEGWITALHFGHLASRRGFALSSGGGFDGSEGSRVVSYLLDQALDSATDDFRQFIFRVAIPEQINVDLAEYLCADVSLPSAVPDYLNETLVRDLFLFPVENENRWFRFHHLIRGLLRDRAGKELGPDLVRSLQIRAFEWHQRNGSVDAAISYAIAAEEPAHAAAAIRKMGHQALADDRWEDVLAWLSRLPDSDVNSDFELLILRALLYSFNGQYDLLEETLDQAAPLIANLDENRDVLRAEFDLLSDLLPGPTTDATDYEDRLERVARLVAGSNRFTELLAIFLYGESLGLRDQAAGTRYLHKIVAENGIRSDGFSRARTIWARAALCNLASLSEDIESFREESQLLLIAATASNRRSLLGHGQCYSGQYHYEVNRIADALPHFQACIANPSARVLARIVSTTLLARSYQVLGRGYEADNVLDEQLDLALDSGAVGAVPVIRLGKASVALMRGEYLDVLSILRTTKNTDDDWPYRSVDSYSLLKVLAELGANQIDHGSDVDELLELLSSRVERFNYHGGRIAVSLASGLLAYKRGDPAGAMGRIDEALSLAARSGHVRTVLDLGPDVANLLKWRREQGAPPPYLDNLAFSHSSVSPGSQVGRSSPLLSRSTNMPTPFAGAVPEDLTEREIDVLLGLQKRQTNKEIADDLSISHLTVKSHTRSIYGKLGVNSRRQAIVRAINIGILSNTAPAPIESRTPARRDIWRGIDHADAG